jgi:AcrR family transcriptional regulator
MPTVPMTRARLSAVQRRAQIIAAAREVIMEQGLSGTRSRLIAERAGITEAYLYRHFHSKDEIYRLAIDIPLEELIGRLQSEIHELAQREDASRADVVFRCHQLFLECMLEIAPLVAASLFAGPDTGREFYLDSLLPRLRAVVASLVPDITGWHLKDLEVDVFVEAFVGTSLGFAFEQLIDDMGVDLNEVAKQLTRMFAPGMLPSHPRDRRSSRSRNQVRLRAAQLAVEQERIATRTGRRIDSVTDDAKDSEPDSTGSARRRLPAPERRRRLVAAARQVFLEQGLRGARTKEIADRSGVTEAFLYRYFDSKDEMYEAAILDPVRDGIAELTADVERIHKDVADPIEFVRHVNRRSLRYYRENARMYSVALYADPVSGREFYSKVLKRDLNKMGRLVASHVPQWAQEGVDPQIVRRATSGAQFMIGLDYALRDETLDVDAVADNLTKLFTWGVKEKESARPAAAARA